MGNITKRAFLIEKSLTNNVNNKESSADAGEDRKTKLAYTGHFHHRLIVLSKMPILQSRIEAMKGILAISKQDFPNVLLIDTNLNSVLHAQSVQIFTDDKCRHHSEADSVEKTEYMTFDSVINTIDKTNTFSIIVIDRSSKESVVEALKTSNIRNVGVLIIGKTDKLHVLPNVFISKTKPETVIKDAESLLERCAFGILARVYFNLERFRLQKTLSRSDEAKLEDVFDLIKLSFENSNIPSEEMPDIYVSPDVRREYPANIEEVMQTITAIPGVIVCFKKGGMLQIYIDKLEASPNIEDTIRAQLNRNEYRISFGKTQQLSQCASGDSVFQSMGTLGGFVKKVALPTAYVKYPINVSTHNCVACSTSTTEIGAVATDPSSSDTNEPTTAALVSRHIFQRMNMPLLIVDRIQTPIGRIADLRQNAEIDILPIDVDEACKHLCDPRFRTELNVSMYSKLRHSGDIRALRGKPVHIWGAKSTPGYGILVEHDARAANGLRIIIRDRRTDEPFAQEGDSGAMVCYFDPRNEILYAVAMLINSVQLEGQTTNRRYTAQILDDGLQKLSIMNGCHFLIFEDETETNEHT